MADNKATVTLSIVDLTQNRLKDYRKDIEALAKMRGSTAMTSQDKEDARTLADMGRSLREQERGWSGVKREADGARSSVKGVADALKGGFGGAVGGAGLGSVGSLLTAGSITAAVAAVGVIVGQSVRMAYEFEKSATRAAQSLSIGTGPNLQQSISTIKNASAAGLAYNISSPEMARAIATYGAASGQGVQQSAAAARGIGMYSRAYGMEPAEVAQIVGQVTSMSNRSFDSEAAGMFGAANDAGNLGRRLPEFLSLATSTLATLQANNMNDRFSGADAAGYVANIAKRGGYYATSAGENAFMGAADNLMSGTSSNPGSLYRALSAGISLTDIQLERANPQNDAKMLRQVLKTSGLNGNGTPDMNQLIGILESQGFSPKQTGALVGQFYDLDTGRLANGKTSLNQAISDTFSTRTPGQATGAADAKTRADQYLGTELGTYEKLFTDVQQKELELGQTILKGLTSTANGLDKLINGNFSLAAAGLASVLGLNTVATAMNTLALARGGGFKIGDLFKRGAGAAGEAAEGAEGAEAAAGAAGGIGALPLAIGAAVTGLGLYGLYEGVGGSKFSQSQDFYHIAMSGNSEQGARALAYNAPWTGKFSNEINAAAKRHGIPPVLLASIALQEHGGAFGNNDGAMNKDGTQDLGWFQLNNRYQGDWLKTHDAHNFGQAADRAASIIADEWKKSHDVRTIGELYNGGAGAIGHEEMTTNRYGDRLQQTVDGASSNTMLPDGNGGFVSVHVKATAAHHPARRPATQSKIRNRA